VSVLSRRDSRTQPGVLTPGAYKKKRRPEGAVEAMPQVCKTLIKRAVDQNCLPPLQGGSFLACSPGLKPRAESCSPFGTKTSVIPVRKIEATRVSTSAKVVRPFGSLALPFVAIRALF
jgi:hypothetical protein